jgi:hypothetical protein
MRLARKAKAEGLNFTSRGEDRSLYGVIGERRSWHSHNVNVLRKVGLERAAEYELKLKLATQLIDIGYKALASKLHPDKGGSPEAMARLNEVRSELKQHTWRR